MSEPYVPTQPAQPDTFGTPRPYADEDPVLAAQITTLTKQAAAEAAARAQGQQAQWMMPDLGKWDGDLFTPGFQDIEKAFSRQQSNAWFVQATSDPKKPGTNGDLVVTSIQADYLAIMERSFRARHTMRRPRALAHAMGRKGGHGLDNGPLKQMVSATIRNLVVNSRSGGQGTVAAAGVPA